MTEDHLEYLKTNQQELALKLLRHCCILAATKYGWHKDKTLPLGKYPDTIVCEVVADYVEGRRHFKADVSVETQLKNAVRSELSALHKRKEAHAVSFQLGDDDNSPRDFATDGPRPDEETMNAHDAEVLFRLLAEHPKVKGDEELEYLLIAIEEGADNPPSMAAATGYPEEQIYKLTKKLRTIYPAVLRQFQKGMELSK